MNHCVIMTVYRDLSMINKFVEHIPSDWGIYIHIDMKSNIDVSQIHRGNVYKMKNIYWGGREHLEAFLYLLKQTMLSDKKYDYYHLVTGSDFFVVSPNRFDEILGKSGNSYIEIFDIPKRGWWNYKILKYRTLASFCDIRKPFNKIMNWTYCFFQLILLRTRNLPSYQIYGGSVYCSLTFEAVNEVLTSEIAKDLYQRLRNSICGEEIFFQTVLMNSYLRDKLCNDSLRYIDWSVQSPPKTLAEDDFPIIKKGDFLFCCKLDSVKSSALIHCLEHSW